MTAQRDDLYVVVKNDEAQYSVWPIDKDPPAGWQAQEMSGTKQDCLAYIEANWIDMRPLSLRRIADGVAPGNDIEP